jgi:hypothetical protein
VYGRKAGEKPTIWLFEHRTPGAIAKGSRAGRVPAASQRPGVRLAFHRATGTMNSLTRTGCSPPQGGGRRPHFTIATPRFRSGHFKELCPVRQSGKRAASGSLVLEIYMRPAGRPFGVCRPRSASHTHTLVQRASSRAASPQPGHGIWLATRRTAGLSDALGDVGTESTPGGHRRSPNPRSGTGSRKSDTTENKRGGEGGDKKTRPLLLPLWVSSRFAQRIRHAGGMRKG